MKNAMKSVLIAAIVAGAGLATGVVDAQNQEHSHTSTHTSMMLSATSPGGQDYSVKIEDGEVVDVRVDGEPTDNYEYDLEDGSLVIEADNGERIVADMSFVTDGDFNSGSIRTIPPMAEGNFFDPQPDGGLFPGGAFTITGSVEPPKTMIGITHDSVDEQLRRYLGLEPGEGVMVLDVRDGLPAAEAGIKANDIILEIDGKRLDSPDVLFDVLNDHEDGDTVKVVVLRQGKERTLKLKLQKYDAEKLGGRSMKLRMRGEFPDAPEVPGVPRAPRLRMMPGGLGDAGDDIFGNIDIEGLDPRIRKQVEESLRQAREQMSMAQEQARMLNRGDVLRRGDDNQPMIIERGDQRDSTRNRLLKERNRELENRLNRLEERLDRLLDKLEESR